MTPPRTHPLETKIPPVVVFGAVWLAQWGWARLGLLPTWPVPALYAAGRLLFFLALAIGVGAVVHFVRARTSIDPHAPAKASTLVTGGLYRISRNPMYLALLLILVGRGMRAGDPVQFVLTAAFVLYMTRFQIQPEERALAAHFGEEYAAFRRRTRRWV